ncbi:gamma-glutamylcyclotransferase family protein [Palleronia sp. LCG004]|uniref:gamma-glutamylcyclotransferase family protein n=1 Tax=Palleronia sp. LCG004 TaxID=3079304 RepID=UPI00294345AB|nr:gamma-glutamylcyclotransferase family protein [Palleronia sp. LCG004]WOI55789.1 gamma-glutamylcyclotransferase family protein [Palleronia sp. LCG004]
MSDPYFFGYGSLVNVGSHAYRPTVRGVLPGWRRRWRATHLRPAAFLTAARDPDVEIEGLIAPVPGADWAALDLREGGYDRLEAAGLRHDLGRDAHVAVYAIPESMDPADGPCPILLSYLDVVVKGYLDEFGEAGVARFMETTDGWETPAADDRDAPLYPRAQDVGGDVRTLVDDWLDRLGCPHIDIAETALGQAG